MKLFKIFDIKIKISYLIFLILVFSMFFNYFSQLIILIIVILIHELAHCCACAYYNIKVSEIVIFIFGGVAKYEGNIEENPKEEIVVAIAGPLSNFIFIIITFFIINKFKVNYNINIQLFLAFNITIGLFNLIPILPLDGGRIARGIIAHYLGIKKATYIIIKLGYSICILLFFIGIYTALVYNIQYIFISFLFTYIFFANKKEKERINFIFIKNIILKKKSLFNEGIMDAKYMVAMEFVDIKNIFDKFTLEQYCIIIVIDTTGKVTGTLLECEIIDAIIKYDNNVTLRDLL